MNALGSVKMQKRIVVKSIMTVTAMGKEEVMKARAKGKDMISMAMDWEKDMVVTNQITNQITNQRIVSAAIGGAGARALELVEEAPSRVIAMSGSNQNMEVIHALLFMNNGLAIPTLAVVMAAMAVVMRAAAAVAVAVAVAVAAMMVAMAVVATTQVLEATKQKDKVISVSLAHLMLLVNS